MSSDLEIFKSIVQSVGLGGSVIFLAGYWITRHLIPRMQEENTSTRQEFLKSLKDIEDSHERSVQRLIEECRIERKEVIEALQKSYGYTNDGGR